MYSVVLMVAVTAGADSPDFGRRNRCNGGGCHGGYVSCHGGHYGGHYGCGCYGGGWGCHGGHVYGGYGGGFGCSGCYGGFGGGWGCHGGHVHGGCHGGHVYGGHGYHGSIGSSYVPYASSTTTSRSTASLVVELPADAALSIDGQATSSTSGTRRFVSPPLDPGSEYTYTLRATVTRDGAPVSITRDVNVRPGQETRVRLDLPTSSVATRD